MALSFSNRELGGLGDDVSGFLGTEKTLADSAKEKLKDTTEDLKEFGAQSKVKLTKWNEDMGKKLSAASEVAKTNLESGRQRLGKMTEGVREKIGGSSLGGEVVESETTAVSEGSTLQGINQTGMRAVSAVSNWTSGLTGKLRESVTAFGNSRSESNESDINQTTLLEDSESSTESAAEPSRLLEKSAGAVKELGSKSSELLSKGGEAVKDYGGRGAGVVYEYGSKSAEAMKDVSSKSAEVLGTWTNGLAARLRKSDDKTGDQAVDGSSEHASEASSSVGEKGSAATIEKSTSAPLAGFMEKSKSALSSLGEASKYAVVSSVEASKSLGKSSKSAMDQVGNWGGWSEMKDLGSFMKEDFNDFSNEFQESIADLSIRMFQGAESRDSSGAALLLHSLEVDMQKVDALNDRNDEKAKEATRQHHLLIDKWTKVRGVWSAYEAELEQMPVLQKELAEVKDRMMKVALEIEQLEDVLEEVEITAENNAVITSRLQFEKEYDAREAAHRQKVKRWGEAQQSWIDTAANNKKNRTSSQAEAVAALEAQLEQEALALKQKLETTAQECPEIKDVSLNLSSTDNKLVSKSELAEFYCDDDDDGEEEEERPRHRRGRKKADVDEPLRRRGTESKEEGEME